METQIQTANSFMRFAINATNVSAHRTGVISTVGQHLTCQPVLPAMFISNNIRSRQHQKAAPGHGKIGLRVCGGGEDRTESTTLEETPTKPVEQVVCEILN